MAWTYNAHCQCMAAVQSQTLTHLLHHYNKPLTDTQTTTDDLCKLIWTHAGSFEDPTHQEQKQNTFYLPTALFNALTEITTATTNLYTNGIRTSPSPLRYHSQHEIDTNFGDRAPIFTCKWRGAGVAQLPNNPETIAKELDGQSSQRITATMIPPQTCPVAQHYFPKNSPNNMACNGSFNTPESAT